MSIEKNFDMAQWIVEREIAELDVEAYRRAAASIRGDLARSMGDLYQTVGNRRCEQMTR
jgi:hypothetical protein